MQREDQVQRRGQERAGLVFGLVGVLCFSLTFPATRIAVASMDVAFVGLGRALVAAVCAAVALLVTRQRRPNQAELRSLGIVAAGVVIGWPLLSAWALRRVPSTHGAIVNGLLPLATALIGTLKGGERPAWQFWLASGVGSAAVVGFALYSGAGQLHPADLALVAAVIAGGFGYAEGGKLARTLGGWQVISWALVLVAPVLCIPVAFVVWRYGVAAPTQAWVSFGYVAIVSQWLGFFAWYRGLALGGVARVSQVQLLQPFLTLVASALLLGEQLTPVALGFALIVVLSVAVGRRVRVEQRLPQVAADVV